MPDQLMPRQPQPDSHPDPVDLDPTELDFATMEANLAAMEDHLFNAGVAILQAAKTQEEVFQTSIEAIQSALEPGSVEAHPPTLPAATMPSDISLTTIWQRLDRIEQRLDYLIEHLIPPSAIAPPQPPSPPAGGVPAADIAWTEKSLKQAYKTLAGVRSQLGITAKTWKLAVLEANALR